MATVTDNLADSAARHTVYALRWSMGTYRKHLNLIDKMVSDLTYKLNVRAPTDYSMTAARLKVMLAEAKIQSATLYSALSDSINADYRALADYESEFQVSALQSAYPIEMSINSVSGAQIHSAALSQPFRGKVLKDWWSSQQAGIQSQIEQAVRIGYAEGESLSQISTRLRGVGNLSKRQVEAVIRTATQHMAQLARTNTALANQDIIKEEEWSATLDARVTPICLKLDGTRYPIGKGPQIPQHFGERSSRIPITKSWKELGFDDMDEDEPLSNRPFVADKRRVKDIPKSQRDAIIGTTTDKTYSEFAARQPLSFLQDVAGNFRAELVKTGTLPLKALVRNGQWMTIDQIKASESKAIKSAVKKAFG